MSKLTVDRAWLAGLAWDADIYPKCYGEAYVALRKIHEAIDARLAEEDRRAPEPAGRIERIMADVATEGGRAYEYMGDADVISYESLRVILEAHFHGTDSTPDSTAAGGDAGTVDDHKPAPLSHELSVEMALVCSNLPLNRDALAKRLSRMSSQAEELERRLSHRAGGHGAAEHGIERSTKATFVPCDCGCGRSCCAHCGVDVGFVQEAPSAPVAGSGE